MDGLAGNHALHVALYNGHEGLVLKGVHGRGRTRRYGQFPFGPECPKAVGIHLEAGA